MFNQRGQIAENKNVKFLIAAIFPKNKKGQISETMTWVVATTAIIVVLILSISIVNLGFKEKSFSAQGGYSDLLVTKSMTGYLSADGNKVWEEVKDKETYMQDPIDGGRLEKSTIDLAMKIFPVLYKEEYTERVKLFIGINSEWCGFDIMLGASYGACDQSRPFQGIESHSLIADSYRISYERIKLKEGGNKVENTILELILAQPTKI